jgi:NADPH-dependent 2,4-dienoyl-CoA reductase/sulfur reductase-like enzyme
VVVVGEEHGGDREVVRARRLDERLDVVVAVDEDARPARLVADEVGVGEPLGVLGALEDYE